MMIIRIGGLGCAMADKAPRRDWRQATSHSVFGDFGQRALLRAFSSQADSMVSEAIGAKMGFSLAVIFMLNSLTGLSLLTLPYGFSRCGFLVGAGRLYCYYYYYYYCYYYYNYHYYY